MARPRDLTMNADTEQRSNTRSASLTDEAAEPGGLERTYEVHCRPWVLTVDGLPERDCVSVICFRAGLVVNVCNWLDERSNALSSADTGYDLRSIHHIPRAFVLGDSRSSYASIDEVCRTRGTIGMSGSAALYSHT